jgi:dolichyl-phosphate beta-glucosyltransferase
MKMMEENRMKTRIIIPCYNEQDRLEKTVMQILEHIDRKGYVVDIMMIDDGSTDDTLKVMQKLSKVSRVNFMTYNPNRGKGLAVRFGVMATPDDYDWIVFSDADGSSHIKYIMPSLEALGNDVIITNRELETSKVSDVSVLRFISSRIFYLLKFILLGQRISDVQNGLKAFRVPMAHKLFEKSRLDGFAFDCEIIYIAQKNGVDVAEVPVVWLNTPDSRVRVVRDSWKMLKDLFKIRYYEKKGYYDM